MSNSFAAYRRSVFEELGGFPEHTILAEDMFMAAKMIESGYKVGYCAESAVRHSHNYRPREEFKRYFDTGFSILVIPGFSVILVVQEGKELVL